MNFSSSITKDISIEREPTKFVKIGTLALVNPFFLTQGHLMRGVRNGRPIRGQLPPILANQHYLLPLSNNLRLGEEILRGEIPKLGPEGAVL